jgi:hypothetical protein
MPDDDTPQADGQPADDQPAEQSEEQPADSDQAVDQSEEQPTDSNQPAQQAEEQPADSDQPAEQSEGQPAESEQAADQPADTDQATEQPQEQGTDSDQAAEQVEEQPADSNQPTASGSTESTVAFAGGDTSSGAGSGSGATNVGASSKSAGTVMSPFPAAQFPDLVRDTGKLKAAFTAAKGEVKADPSLVGGLVDVDGNPLDVDKIPMAIASLNLDGTTSVIGQHDVTEMFFSGSLLKIAAMYAAFQLRHAVNDLAGTLDPNLPISDFFTKVRATFDLQIKNAVKLLSDRGFHQVPKYETIFTPTLGGDGKYMVAFRSDADPKFDFQHHLQEMIVNSHNPSAGLVIQSLGYNLINGVLEKGGFFRNNSTGIWLAGDYLPNPVPNTTFPEFVEERALGLVGGNVVTIASLNDGPVKQVTTCIDPVKMFVLLANEELVSNPHDSDDTANADMLKMTADAVTGAGAPSRFTRAAPLPAFTVLNCKIGLGELKGGGVCPTFRCVTSEVSILQHTSGRQFVTMFQNINVAGARHFHMIAEIFQRTMDKFLS